MLFITYVNCNNCIERVISRHYDKQHNEKNKKSIFLYKSFATIKYAMINPVQLDGNYPCVIAQAPSGNASPLAIQRG